MQFDITSKLSKFMDKHQVLHLLQHLQQATSSSRRFEFDAAEDEALNAEDGESSSENTKSKSLVTKVPMKENDDEDETISFYSAFGINECLYKVLKGTFMFDDQSNIYSHLMSSMKEDDKKGSFEKMDEEALALRREEFIKRVSECQAKCDKLLTILGEDNNINDLIKHKRFSMLYMKETYDITLEELESLLEYARMRYEMGYYENTDKILEYYIELCDHDEIKKHQAMFGKLAVEILLEKWQNAVTSCEAVKRHIGTVTRLINARSRIATAAAAANEKKDEQKDEKDEKDEKDDSDEKENEKPRDESSNSTINKNSAALGLRENAWLLHWSLFIYFNQNDGAYLDALYSNFKDELNTIETIAPHLLRYMAAAILISESISDKMQKLIEISITIDEEQYTYKDPITEFVRLVIRTNDFEEGSRMLKLAYQVCKKDFFLSYYSHYFLQYARLVFVQKYCRLYSKISVDNLSRLLWLNHLSREEVQNWMVNAMREIQSWANPQQREKIIDARLDVGNNTLFVQVRDINPYQIVLEKTKLLSKRTHYIAEDLQTNNKYKEQQPTN